MTSQQNANYPNHCPFMKVLSTLRQLRKWTLWAVGKRKCRWFLCSYPAEKLKRCSMVHNLARLVKSPVQGLMWWRWPKGLVEVPFFYPIPRQDRLLCSWNNHTGDTLMWSSRREIQAAGSSHASLFSWGSVSCQMHWQNEKLYKLILVWRLSALQKEIPFSISYKFFIYYKCSSMPRR